MSVRFLLFLLLILNACSAKKILSPYTDTLNEYRETYKNGFLKDPRSPLTAEDIKDLDFFPADENWKLNCTCQRVTDAKPFEMPTYSGVTRTYLLHSIAKCAYKNQNITLHLYKNIHQPINPLYKNNLFLPFKDYTNNESTYGGGRYINLMDTDIKNETIEIDLNKSYNPWCAYSDGFNCPIPPRENHIELEVIAGEKNFKGKYKTKVLD
jgi:uncharacterized protein (DUF1684 family)